MRVLVTGANGFVGAALCRKLVERGDEVRGLVRKTSDLSLLEGIPIQKVVGSLNDLNSLKDATETIELVIHAAASVTDWGTYESFHRVNVDGTRTILKASVRAGVKRFVFVSTVAVHSFIGAEEMDESSPQLPTRFPYCRTKREAEALVMEAHHRGRMDVVIVRPGDVFGPGDRVSLLKMVGLLEAGRMATVGGGRVLGAFTYVENLADGIILAGITEAAAGEAFVITDGIKLTWRDYFWKLTEAIDVPKPRISVNPKLAYAAAVVLESIYGCFRLRSRPPITRYLVTHLRKDFHFSIDKARRLLGYEPKVDIDEAIRRTADWYRKVVRGEGGS
ncbi:MAG: NAD-dependent epimerase/dehydratase family protein [bacterium]